MKITGILLLLIGAANILFGPAWFNLIIGALCVGVGLYHFLET